VSSAFACTHRPSPLPLPPPPPLTFSALRAFSSAAAAALCAALSSSFACRISLSALAWIFASSALLAPPDLPSLCAAISFFFCFANFSCSSFSFLSAFLLARSSVLEITATARTASALTPFLTSTTRKERR